MIGDSEKLYVNQPHNTNPNPTLSISTSRPCTRLQLIASPDVTLRTTLHVMTPIDRKRHGLEYDTTANCLQLRIPLPAASK